MCPPRPLNLMQHQINPFSLPHTFSLKPKFFSPYPTAKRSPAIFTLRLANWPSRGGPGLGPAFPIQFFFLHGQTEHHGGGCRGGKNKSWLPCVLITGYTNCVMEEVQFNTQTTHSTTNSAYGNNRQPAVIRSLEHMFISSVYKRKLLPPPPTRSATQWQTGDIHLFPTLIDQNITKLWPLRKPCSSSQW